ncbi:MAG: hypothetical protein Kow00117_16510 [Phototrophicales bacterium]|nr:MAG: rod shape-determining protein MreD [Chloroflexota bacterium]
MGNFLSLPILTLAAILQATLVPQIRLLGGGPDLVYLLVLCWAINAELDSAVLWAFVGGISVDLLSSQPTGTSVLGMLITVFAISGIGQQVYRIGIILLISLVIIGTIVQQIVVLIIVLLTGHPVDLWLSLGYIIAPTILYNLVFILPVYWFIRMIQSRLE